MQSLWRLLIDWADLTVGQEEGGGASLRIESPGRIREDEGDLTSEASTFGVVIGGTDDSDECTGECP